MSFLYPYFLLLSFAIAIPIAIHLFNFHRFKQVFFTNVSILKNIELSTKKKSTLYDRLLLLFRCLSILFLSLLFSQPYIKDENQKLVGDNDNAVVIIVDNSFSMQNTSNKESMLFNAKLKAKEILSQYSDNDVFCLLTMDMEGKHKHFVTKQTFLDFLKDVDISSSSYPYSKLLNTAHHLLSLRNEKNKRCFFVSDYQQSEFDRENFKNDKSNIHDVFLPLEAKNINNVFIDSISFQRNFFNKNQKVNMNVRISNFSKDDAEKLAVKLFINDRQKSLVTVDIKANSTIDVPMSFVVEQTGILKGKIHIIDNPITYDDDFFFTLNINDKLSLLSINGDGENKYINKLFSKDDQITIDNMNESSIDFSKFSQYNTIILNSLNNISSGLAMEINRFRNNGGSVIIVPNKNLNFTSYKSAMISMNLPFYSTMINKETKVSKIDINNSLYHNVFTSITENMEKPTSKKYYKISSNGNTSRQDIISYVNNDAFLTESFKGKSVAYVFSTAFDEDFSNFTNQSLFVPTLLNMVIYSNVCQKPFIFMNEESFFDLSMLKKDNKTNNDKNEIITLVKDDNNNIKIIPQMTMRLNRNGFIIKNNFKKDGIYMINGEDKTLGAVAINYPREESKLVFMNSKEINKALKQNNYKNFNVFNDRKMISSYFSDSNKGFDFTFIILVIILLCLASESYLLYKLKNKS